MGKVGNYNSGWNNFEKYPLTPMGYYLIFPNEGTPNEVNSEVNNEHPPAKFRLFKKCSSKNS